MSLVRTPGGTRCGANCKANLPIMQYSPKGRAEGFSAALPRRGRLSRTGYPSVRRHLGVLLPRQAGTPQAANPQDDCCLCSCCLSAFVWGVGSLCPRGSAVVGAWLEFQKLGGMGLHKAGFWVRTCAVYAGNQGLLQETCRRKLLMRAGCWAYRASARFQALT